MLKLLKNLKPYAHIVALCVVLIFIQAMCDLKLPDLMSDIVNIGLQNQGVDSVYSDVLSVSAYNALTDKENGIKTENFGDAQKDLIAAVYQKTDAAAANKKVKSLKTNVEVYVRRDLLGKTKLKKTDALTEALQDGYIYLLAADMARAVLISDEFAVIYNGGYPNLIVVEEMMASGDTNVKMTGAMVMTMASLVNAPGGGAEAVSAFLETLKGADLLSALNSSNPIIKTTVEATVGAMLSAVMSGIPSDFKNDVAISQVKAEMIKSGVDMNKRQSRYIWLHGLLMLAVALLSAVCTLSIGYFAAKTAAKFVRDIRFKLFKKVESFSNREVDKFTTASLITRSTNDLTQIQQLIMLMIRMIFYAPILGGGAIIYSLQKDRGFHLTWINLLAVGVLILMVTVVFIIALPKFKRVQKLIDKLNLVMREGLMGMPVIRAFAKQKFESKRFDKVNVDLTKTNLFINRIMIFFMPLMTLLMSGMSILIMWYGSGLIMDGKFKVGDLMAFMQYAMQIVMAFLMIAMMFIMVPRASVSANRINEVLETDPVIKDSSAARSLNGKGRGVLSFENVGFKYDGAEINALTDISFTAKPGKVFAIVGGTGSGKSTIINLMPRFYDATAGRITLDGIDIKELSLHELRENISIVPQKSLLFSGTVATNLRFANAAIDGGGMARALATAQISSFIADKPEGVEMSIAQGGGNVSGGQKQRLSIARALAKEKAPILVFDDSFSALDFKTDAALRRALKTDIQDKTVIIVAQRIGTIKDADEILVLNSEGKTVGLGTHAQLMQSCTEYVEIALSQLNKEELA